MSVEVVKYPTSDSLTVSVDPLFLKVKRCPLGWGGTSNPAPVVSPLEVSVDRAYTSSYFEPGVGGSTEIVETVGRLFHCCEITSNLGGPPFIGCSPKCGPLPPV